ncbi:MAG: lasso peptide biosynthesis B2 protein [Lachnospiraceae bacterium]|nr:lasso peptide biosynthesis B2 protein [Lachnospiraceae bacterium]
MSIIGFFKYNKNRRITIEAWYFCMWYRLLIRFLPSNKLEKRFGIRDQETSREVSKRDYYWAYRAGYEANRIAEKTPWDSKCLVRALAARKILERRKVATTLYLGVGWEVKEKNPMIAHAWLRCGELYVTGGNGEGYAIVAMYGNSSEDK